MSFGVMAPLASCCGDQHRYHRQQRHVCHPSLPLRLSPSTHLSLPPRHHHPRLSPSSSHFTTTTSGRWQWRHRFRCQWSSTSRRRGAGKRVCHAADLGHSLCALTSETDILPIFAPSQAMPRDRSIFCDALRDESRCSLCQGSYMSTLHDPAASSALRLDCAIAASMRLSDVCRAP